MRTVLSFLHQLTFVARFIMSMNAEAVEQFLKEVTQELLYNIVFNQKSTKPKDLRDKFQKKTGYRPMQFFGFGNENGLRFFDLVKEIPGLEAGNNKIYICDDSDKADSDGSDKDSNDDSDADSEDSSEDEYKATCIFKTFNTTYLKQEGANSSLVSVATYREFLLIKCCEMISDEFSDSKDKNGNTPLHIIAALPGVTYDCSTLVKYLLKAGVDPLETNESGQTLLHVLFGRFHAFEEDNGALTWFDNVRVTETEWCVEDQCAVLNLLSEELSNAHRVLLAKAQDNNGNTVLHEYALATTVEQELIQERRIAKKLLEFGASLTVPNNSGEVPLHYAFNPSVFQIFLQKGAFFRARNYRDETPVLFILKKAVDLAYSETSASTDLADQGFVEISSCGKSVSKALKLLKNLKSTVSNHEDVRETVWIPDLKGNIAIDIVLLAIRIASYDLNCFSRREANKVRLSLVKLLRAMIRKASPRDMKWQNENGQTFLHVLLDMGDGSEYEIIEEAGIVNSVEILLNYDVDVNAVDVNGQTPLDITYKYRENGPTVYDKCVTMITEYILAQEVSNLHIHDETRKLRKCPKRYWDNAQCLTDPSSEVVVVGKYRYSNEDPIGSGAFSTVFVAIKDENVDSRSGTIQCRAYALKRLDKAKINRQEIKREINTLLSVSDENIIQCHESFEKDFFQYLCLDLMDGDLSGFVANREVNSVIKKDPARAVHVMQDIISGLKYLHNHGFIHRDLKPGNILYTTDPDLLFKIGDFGLTKNISNTSTMTSTENDFGMIPGTRCWMAPELVSRHSREHTKQSDLFSLGLVLYYLFTFGKHPFVEERNEAPDITESRIKKMQTCFDRKLHPEAASFFQTVLSKNPEKRPPAACLYQHPFLWSECKKIEFLKAVGDQPEAESPSRFPNSQLERYLQKTTTGKSLNRLSWDQKFEDLYEEISTAWTKKKYRTDKVIDLIRFIRNAYAHRQNRTLEMQEDLRRNIFRQEYPSLVLDVFDVVQKLDFHAAKDRKNIREALSL